MLIGSLFQPHVGCKARSEKKEVRSDQDPEEGQDVQGGVVDQATHCLGHQPEDANDGEDLLQAP